ncbi:hypothetical protein [Nocardioides perillae]|uniref:Energy-coupling factor transport system substrate-specific component n=1 Tax=Nocardioides perillae TaxID=1119534 RepID=A0A7Y9USV9_9ACTN|nr:hypothetical protein [Nocardioides perillae]NYG56624.1 energy-coupling factor transport system substrate-specific component [Nocardioides perillae]
MAPGQDAATRPRAGRWDPVVAELQSLRQRAGEPSYAEIARRVVAQRVAGGSTEHAARLAKSTVHDAFRLGRTRLNLPLTRELVQALGGDPAAVDDWVAASAQQAAVPGPGVPAASAAPSPEAEAAEALGSPGRAEPLRPTWRLGLVVAAACVALNLAGRVVVDALDLPVHLDMVGTAVAAFSLGPWAGAGVGVATNALGTVSSGWVSLPFALVNVAGALVWGYGVRRWGLGRTLPRFLSLQVLVAVVCTLVAVPVLVALDGAVSRGGGDLLAQVGGVALDSLVLAVGLANVLTSLADKVISGFVALVVVSTLPRTLRAAVPLALAAAPPPSPGDPVQRT